MIYETTQVRDQLPFKAHISNGGTGLASSEVVSMCVQVRMSTGGLGEEPRTEWVGRKEVSTKHREYDWKAHVKRAAFCLAWALARSPPSFC